MVATTRTALTPVVMAFSSRRRHGQGSLGTARRRRDLFLRAGNRAAYVAQRRRRPGARGSGGAAVLGGGTRGQAEGDTNQAHRGRHAGEPIFRPLLRLRALCRSIWRASGILAA